MTRGWLSRFPAACGLFYVIIALVASGSGDDTAPTSTSSGRAIAAYAAAHQAGAFAGLGEMVALLALAVFAVALYTALSRTEAAKEAAVVVLIGGVLTVAIKLGSFPAYFALYSGGQTTDPAVARAMLQMNAYAFEITLFTQALLLSGVAIGGLVGGAIPRWLAATAGVLAVALVVSFPVFASKGFNPIELFWLAWVVVASVTLTIRHTAAAAMRQREAITATP
ncbi:MAG: hypothetical protein ABI959_12310 [Candidatus Dormiibacterota bacterium]